MICLEFSLICRCILFNLFGFCLVVIYVINRRRISVNSCIFDCHVNSTFRLDFATFGIYDCDVISCQLIDVFFDCLYRISYL